MLLRIKSKKGLSIMIGYVLLVTIGIVMSLIVYQWIKTYVPSESLKCPDGVSIFIKETKYDCANYKLNVTVKNNGRFNIAGYFIHAATTEDQELATTDLSGEIEFGGEIYGNSLVFVLGEKNSLTPDSPHNEKKTIFDLTSIGQIYKIEITPVRFQEDEKERTRFASCSDDKVGVMLDCWEECVPGTCASLGYDCGTWFDDCVGTLDCDIEVGCEGADECDGNGQCVPPEECLDTCEGLGYECGTVCGEPCETCDPVTEECVGGVCELLCGNSVIDTGEEECDDGDRDDGDGCSSTCIIEIGWDCDIVVEPSECYRCDGDGDCEPLDDETCRCIEDCEGKKGPCGDGLMCEDGSCVDMPAIETCESYCFIMYGANPALSGCALNCNDPGGCTGSIACFESGSEYCIPGNDHHCCCMP